MAATVVETLAFPVFVFAVSLPFFMLCHSASSCHYTTPQIFRGAVSLWNFPPLDLNPHREETAAAQALCWKPTCCLLGLTECPQNTMQILQNLLPFKLLCTTKPGLCCIYVTESDWKGRRTLQAESIKAVASLYLHNSSNDYLEIRVVHPNHKKNISLNGIAQHFGKYTFVVFLSVKYSEWY